MNEQNTSAGCVSVAFVLAGVFALSLLSSVIMMLLY